MSNVQKLTHRVKQNDETGKYVWNKSKDKVLRGKSNEMEISNLPDKQFKVMVIRIFRNSGEEWMNTVRTPTMRWKI